MSANFYLSSAFSLHAGLDGLDRKIDPGMPLNDNLYLARDMAQRGRNIRRLPRTLLEAADALEESDFAREVLGSGFVDIYVAQKRKEWDSQFYMVTPTERDRYLTFV